MHPHGVKYNPEYDGAYMGEYTRAGGFIAPGESFTYQWECTPESVGAWPYHDHGPNHTLNTFRGLFGAIIVRPSGAKCAGPRRTRCSRTSCRRRSPAASELPLLQRPRVRRQHADADRARRRGRRDPRVRHGLELPHLPHPRPPLDGCRRGRSSTTRRWGPNEIGHGPLRRGQPRSLALPLPRLLPSGRGDGGLVRGRPVEREENAIAHHRCHRPSPCWRPRCSRPPRASAQTYPAPKDPARSSRSRRARTRPTPCARSRRATSRTIQKAVNKARAGDTIRVRNGIYREAVKINGKRSATCKLVGNAKNPAKVAARWPRATCRTASSSTTPTRSPSTASWPATTRPTASSSRTSTATR